MNFRYSVIPILSLLLVLASCTFQSRSTKMPILKDEETFDQEIYELVKTNDVSISGTHSNTNGVEKSEVTITVLNPDVENKTVIEKTILSKKIATLLKKHLKNSKEFDQYKVGFQFDGPITEIVEQTYPSTALE